jgi:glycosyltransferase involved in cell wall biosynthesis
MPVYNRAKYLRQAIDSVLTQSFTDFELIAVDDGSTDGSEEILASYGTRIKTLRQRNQGAEAARNAAAAVAQGEYLVLLDSDDFFFPFTLSIYDQIARSFDAPPLILGREMYFYDGQPLPAEPFQPRPVTVLKFKDYLSKTISLSNFNSKLAIKRSLFHEVGGGRNSNAQTWLNDDMHLMLKVGTRGPMIVVQDVYTAAYRQHAENTIKNVKGIADSLIQFAHAERSGEYTSGSKVARRAIIGARSVNWAYRYCWRSGERKLAVQLVWKTAPMIAAAVWNRTVRRFRDPVSSFALPAPQATSSSQSPGV